VHDSDAFCDLNSKFILASWHAALPHELGRYMGRLLAAFGPKFGPQTNGKSMAATPQQT
jgi:hypothetical protein